MISRFLTLSSSFILCLASMTSASAFPLLNTSPVIPDSTYQISVNSSWIDETGASLSTEDALNHSTLIRLYEYRREVYGTLLRFIKEENGVLTPDILPMCIIDKNQEPEFLMEDLSEGEILITGEYGDPYDSEELGEYDGDCYYLDENTVNEYAVLYVYLIGRDPEELELNAEAGETGSPERLGTSQSITLTGQNAASAFIDLPSMMEEQGSAFLLSYAVQSEGSNALSIQTEVNGSIVDPASFADSIHSASTVLITHTVASAEPSSDTPVSLPSTGGSGAPLLRSLGVLLFTAYLIHTILK